MSLMNGNLGTSWVEDPNASPSDDVKASIRRALDNTGDGYNFAAHQAATARGVIDRFSNWLAGGRYKAANHLLSPHVCDLPHVGPLLAALLLQVGRPHAAHLPAFAPFEAEYHARFAASGLSDNWSAARLDHQAWADREADIAQAENTPETRA